MAALDLEIRGAGNLLGGEQSGHIETVGFEMYTKLLEQAVQELKGEEIEDDVRAVVNLRVDLKIDAAYVPDMNQRLMIYRRVADARTDGELDSILKELRDRFGPSPETVEHLEQYGRIRILADRLGVEAIDREGQTVLIRVPAGCPGQTSESRAAARDRGPAKRDEAPAPGHSQTGLASAGRAERSRAEPDANRSRGGRCRHEGQGPPEHRNQLVDNEGNRWRGDVGLYQGRDSEATEGRPQRPRRRLYQGARFAGRTRESTIEG